MKYWVEAMEDGLVHVDAVNKFGDTFGVAFVGCSSNLVWHKKYWLHYWTLKPNVQNFWTSLVKNYFALDDVLFQKERFQTVILSRMADIPALWEDLLFLYSLLAGHSPRLAWLVPELDRRVCASLRFVWIVAVAR
jgi:hypothetical protein